uniref:Nodulation signaling pathway 2-like protein n=1 Tax=Kalanchoe fedtschenkoi TaxID=63787 RepID=A0A7N1A7X3_KALFE
MDFNFLESLEFPWSTEESQNWVMEDFPPSLWSTEGSQSWDMEEEEELQQYAWNQVDGVLSMDSSFSTQNSCTVEFGACDSGQVTMTNAPSELACNELSLAHLLKAHAEATEAEHTRLMEVIQTCVLDQAGPVGETTERLSFYLFKPQPQYSYLKQESQPNFDVAYKAFYQLFPYGRVPHIAANSAILEALPAHAGTFNIVDFDMGDGVQWAPLIDTLARQNKELSLMAIKWAEDDDFEDTRRRLESHARSVAAKLRVQEVAMEDLVSEVKRISKRCAQAPWFAFNCMVSLPHMIKGRSEEKVRQFLTVAKDLLGDSTNCGMITFGEGEADANKQTNLSNYSSFFERQLARHQALLESVEWTFSEQQLEAKVAIECLFLAPSITSHGWLQKWEHMNEEGNVRAAAATLGLEGLRLGQTTLTEANKLVRRGEDSSYKLRLGEDENEMVLEWRGTPLVRLSTWR